LKELPPGDTLPGAGGSTPWNTLTVTIPGFKGKYEHEEVIASAGVLATDYISLMLAPTTDDDENAPDGLALQSLYAVADVDAFTVRLTFAEPTSGPIKLLWRI
jgi:hypothetical protein